MDIKDYLVITGDKISFMDKDQKVIASIVQDADNTIKVFGNLSNIINFILNFK